MSKGCFFFFAAGIQPKKKKKKKKGKGSKKVGRKWKHISGILRKRLEKEALEEEANAETNSLLNPLPIALILEKAEESVPQIRSNSYLQQPIFQYNLPWKCPVAAPNCPYVMCDITSLYQQETQTNIWMGVQPNARVISFMLGMSSDMRSYFVIMLTQHGDLVEQVIRYTDILVSDRQASFLIDKTELWNNFYEQVIERAKRTLSKFVPSQFDHIDISKIESNFQKYQQKQESDRKADQSGEIDDESELLKILIPFTTQPRSLFEIMQYLRENETTALYKPDQIRRLLNENPTKFVHTKSAYLTFQQNNSPKIERNKLILQYLNKNKTNKNKIKVWGDFEFHYQFEPAPPLNWEEEKDLEMCSEIYCSSNVVKLFKKTEVQIDRTREAQMFDLQSNWNTFVNSTVKNLDIALSPTASFHGNSALNNETMSPRLQSPEVAMRSSKESPNLRSPSHSILLSEEENRGETPKPVSNIMSPNTTDPTNFTFTQPSPTPSQPTNLELNSAPSVGAGNQKKKRKVGF